MISVFDVESAPSEALSGHGGQLAESGRDVRECAGNVRAVSGWDGGGSWSGSSADAAAHHLQSIFNRIDTTGASAGAAATVVSVLAGALKALRLAASVALTGARALGFEVRSNGSVHLSAAQAAILPLQRVASALSTALQAAVLAATGADTASHAALSALNSSDVLARPPELAPRPEVVDEVSSSRVDTPRGPVLTFGDVEQADRIITVVSGVGSSTPHGIEKSSEWAERTVGEARARGKKVAVVAWHGYPAPPALLSGASPRVAQESAPDLRRHQEALRARNPTAHLEVLGYSYGSSVVGQAAQAKNFQADSIELWGSPGTPPITDIPVNAHRVPGDPIRLAPEWLEGLPGLSHGKDPAPSSPWDKAMDAYLWFRGERNAHSSYWFDEEVSGVDPLLAMR